MSEVNFGNNLKNLLSSKNMTYKDLAAKCGKVESWVSQIIRRNQIPQKEDLETILKIFGKNNLSKLFLGIDSETNKLPLLSYVQAGQYTETFCDENDVEYIEVPYSNIKEGCFCLQVKGDSMSRSPGKSYYDGIFVIVDPNCDKSKDALNRKVVIARTGEGATIKEFVLEGDKPYLRPWNDRFQILEVTAETVIIGIVIQSFD